MNGAERLIFLGYASSGAIAMEAFFKFSRLKAHCYFFSDSHINAAILAEPLPGDVIFCISHSGESKDVVIPAEQAKPTAKIIALTGSAESPLARIADVCITTFSEEVNYRTEVMVSRIVQLSIIEVLFTACSIRQGPHTLERLKKGSPGGIVSQVLSDGGANHVRGNGISAFSGDPGFPGTPP